MENLEIEYKGEKIRLQSAECLKGTFPMAESLGTAKVEELGKKILKHFAEKAVSGSHMSNQDRQRTQEFFNILENFGMKSPQTKEDLNFPNNPALYTTIVNSVVERAFRPDLIASGLIKSMSINPRGVTAIKFPISALRTAAALPDDGELDAPDNDDYTFETVTLSWIYSYEVVTHQLIQQGIIDVVQDQLYELGDALSRKVDSDIIAAFDTATPSNNANANYEALDATLTYASLLSGILKSEANNAKPNAVVTHPLTLLNFMTDSDVKTALGYNSVDKGSLYPRMRDFFGLSVLTTTQAGVGNTYIIDTTKTKYFVEGSPIQVLDGRKSGTVNWEIIALKLYGVKVIQPKAVYRLVEASEESS
jgi:hypothetical protein